jgi:alkylation response protein AidB-like acyl-CoA dehydrogenase
MYNDVKVPKENRIGEDGFGFKFAMNTLNGGRIGIAAQALGIAAGAYELAVDYAKQREAFGKPISQHQAIAFKIADMATDIEAARLLVYRAAAMKDQHLDYTLRLLLWPNCLPPKRPCATPWKPCKFTVATAM